MDIKYGQLESLHWFWLVAVTAVVSFSALAIHGRAVRQFATTNLLARLLDSRGPRRRFASSLFGLLALVFVVIGLVDIRWGQTEREVPQKGIEVVFVLDVSRSMLAEDVAPNRLSRAKQNIRDMVHEMAGDRVGLVLFAGDVRQHLPLTNHYEDFKQSLDEVGPHNIARGGSKLGEAITEASNAFLEKTADHKAIVLFTDGEDHESDPIAAAKRAREAGIRIFTVGIGDMDRGARIPIQTRGRGETFVEHEGQQVWSRLDGDILKQIAASTNGAFIPAGTKQVDMGAVYHRFISGIEQQDFEAAKINAYIPRYPWFLAAALGLLVFDILTSTWRHGGEAFCADIRKSILRALILTVALFGISSPTVATEKAFELAQQGNASLRAGDFGSAIAHFNESMELGYTDPRLRYNKAIAHYRNGEVDIAQELFASVAVSNDSQLAARARYNLGNADYARAIQVAQQDRAKAVAHLESAIKHYRGTLSSDPTDIDARANIELASRLIKRLLQQQEQKNQQQNSGDQSQQKDKQQQDGSQDRDSESRSKDDSEEQSGQQESSKDQQSEASGERDSPEDNQSHEASDDTADSDDKNESSESARQQNADQQPKKEGNNEQVDSESSQEKPPEGDLKALNQQDTGTQNGPPPQEALKEGQSMTMEEARKMLQAVRDRALRRRIQKLQQMRTRKVPVERDW